MNIHDVRNGEVAALTAVRFADDEEDDGYAQADVIEVELSAKFTSSESDGEVRIKESKNGDYVRVNGAEHARNLIKALEYLIQEGVLA